MDPTEPIQRYRARKVDLWSKRSTLDPMALELAQFISPLSGRFSVTDKNRSKAQFGEVIDSTATGAWQVLRSGISHGMSNPATKWMRLGTPDEELNEQYDVKVWLEDTADRLLSVLGNSNTYEAFAHIYGELPLFGTACSVLLEDDISTIHHYPLTWGQYALATDNRGTVDTMVRELSMTVAQMCSKWGVNNVSLGVQDQYRRGNLDAEITITHLVEPRALRERDPRKVDGKNMAWRSVYFEEGKNKHSTHLLSESGYRWFPVIAPRWSVVGANVYGDSPAMTALNAIKRLQKMTLVEGKAAAYQAEPPTYGPPELKNKPMRPGQHYTTTPGQEIKPIFQPTSRLNDIDILLRRVQDEINARFYRPLFSVISDAEKQMTAMEVREVAGERLSQIGPVIGRVDREMLAPVIDITLNIMFERGMVAPPPSSIQGLDIKARLIGVLAQAQRAGGSQPSDILLNKIATIASTVDPSIRHIYDGEADVRDYADVIGANPRNLRSHEKYSELVAAEAQAQAAMAQSQVVGEQAGAARDMATAVATEQG